jgi:hypothetical protein
MIMNRQQIYCVWKNDQLNHSNTLILYCDICKYWPIFYNSFTAVFRTRFVTNPSKSFHHTLSVLPHYLVESGFSKCCQSTYRSSRTYSDETAQAAWRSTGLTGVFDSTSGFAPRPQTSLRSVFAPPTPLGLGASRLARRCTDSAAGRQTDRPAEIDHTGLYVKD